MSTVRQSPSIWSVRLRASVCTLIVGVATASACGGPSSSSAHCKSLGRDLKDEEFIQIAVTHEIDAHRLGIERDSEKVADYVVHNPRCCSIDRSQNNYSRISRVFGAYFVDVEIKYEVSGAMTATVGKFYEGHVVIEKCGNIDRTYGAGVDGIDAKHV